MFLSKCIPIGSTCNANSRSSRGPHERLIENVESMEVLLHVSFGRAIKYLSTPEKGTDEAQALQLGEKIAAVSLKCFTVRRPHQSFNYSLTMPGLDLLCSV
jgi:hypothetical protein